MTSLADGRIALWRAGFAPLPVAGKRPAIDAWSSKHITNMNEIELWSRLFPAAGNTGALTRLMPTVDIDITMQEPAEAIEWLARERFEEHGYFLVRIGKAPKRAIPLRTDTPFKKIAVPLIGPDGSEQKIELLCDGQQVVMFGIHPDTGMPYQWHGGEPGQIKLEDLPYVNEALAKAFIRDSARLLVERYGYRQVDSIPAMNGHGEIVDVGQHIPIEQCIGRIISGADLHAPMVSLSSALAAYGLDYRGNVRILRGLMGSSSAPRDSRWTDRYEDIERTVRTADKKYKKNTDIADNTEPRLGVFDFGLFSGAIPPREWLYGNIFCRKFGSSLFGDGGIGKTAIRYVQYISMALGRPLIQGEHVFVRSRVLLISLEDDEIEMLRRLTAVVVYYGIDKNDLVGWLYVCAPRNKAGKLFVHGENGSPIKGALCGLIENEISEHKIDFAAIDPFIKSHSLSENSNEEMDEVAGFLADLSDKYNIGYDTPHHTSKGMSDPGNADKGRGASATKNALRLVYTLNAMTADEAAVLGVSDEVRRSLVRMDSGKVNIAPKATDARWYELVSVNLDNGTEIYPSGDNIQVARRWMPPGIFNDLDSRTLNTILDDIQRGMADGRRYSLQNRASDRACWRVIVVVAPEITEMRAKAIVSVWSKSGLLYEREYDDPIQRKKVKGVFVENGKRPDAL